MCEMLSFSPRQKLIRQSGIALITSMVFLVVISIIGISSMQGTRLEQAMNNKMQELNQAFQYSESGIAHGLKHPGLFNIATPPTSYLCTGDDSIPVDCGTGSFPGNATVTSKYITSSKSSPVNFSLESGFSAHFFEVESTGTAKNSISTHRQGIYIIGPSNPGSE